MVLYTAQLNISLPNAHNNGERSSVQVDLRLTTPDSDGAEPIQVQLQASDISFVGDPSQGIQHYLSAATGTSLEDLNVHQGNGSVEQHIFHTLPYGDPIQAHMNQFLPSASSPASPAAESQLELPSIPIERLAPPSGRDAAEDQQVKDCISTALKRANQWSGSRASPLIQIDRLLTRIDLFCHLHRQRQYDKETTAIIPLPNQATPTAGDPDMPIIYWNDLLKYGGLGTAWNERKANRRAYRNIYSDILQYQNHPTIKPFLTSERSKTLDELETAFDLLAGRTPKPQASSVNFAAKIRKQETNLPVASSSNIPIDPFPGDGDQSSSEATDRQKATRKRKREDDHTSEFTTDGAIDLPLVPTTRLSKPTSRPAAEEEEIKQIINSALAEGGQWAGSRPAVITSLSTLTSRIRLLIRLHEKETVKGYQLYWDDLVRHGGISQAWSQKKAGRNAYKYTYAMTLQHCNNPRIRELLASNVQVDIKTAEAALAAAADGSDSPPVTPSTSYLAAPAQQTQMQIAPELLSPSSAHHQAMYAMSHEEGEANESLQPWQEVSAESRQVSRVPEIDELRSDIEEDEGDNEMMENGGHEA